jgi:hypothetical protein
VAGDLHGRWVGEVQGGGLALVELSSGYVVDMDKGDL